MKVEIIFITNNNTLLATGDHEFKVHIYRKPEGLFLLNQTISLTFKIQDLRITNDNLVVVGISSEIVFYKFNGTYYDYF